MVSACLFSHECLVNASSQKQCHLFWISWIEIAGNRVRTGAVCKWGGEW